MDTKQGRKTTPLNALLQIRFEYVLPRKLAVLAAVTIMLPELKNLSRNDTTLLTRSTEIVTWRQRKVWKNLEVWLTRDYFISNRIRAGLSTESQEE